MYIFKIIVEFLKEYKLTVIFYLIVTLCSFPLESVVLPQIYSNFFDILKINFKPNIFIKYILYIFIVLIIVNISNLITSYIESYMIPEINHFIINYIFKFILKKYENNYEEIELGRISTRLDTIPAYIRQFISDFLVWVLPRFLTVLIINIYFFYINFYLGLFSTIGLCIFFYINFKYFSSCSDLSYIKHKLYENKNQNTMELLSNIQSIYSSGKVNDEINNYNKNTKIYTNSFIDNLKCIFKVNFISGFLMVILFITINIITSYLFIIKKISYTNLIAIFIVILYYIPCVMTISQCLPDLVTNYGSLRAIDSFIEDLYNVELNNKKIFYKPIKKINNGNIVINNLLFGYKKNEYIFRNFYLTIKNNEKVAIIGPSGNGKSTLIKLIMGFYPVTNGSIFIDNIDINDYDKNDLRKQISYVNQNTKLFNLSIVENIQYGNNLSIDEIINICNYIDVNNIFQNLHNGLHSKAGIDGANLSGGQKQLILILRNLLKDNKIIILDEPTSAIDIENRDKIINAIAKLTKDKTLIIITHDDSLLSIVNRVIEISSGKIIEDKYINNES